MTGAAKLSLASFAALQVGDLQPWMDESFLYNIFVATNQLVSVKLIRNRATGASEGAATSKVASGVSSAQCSQMQPLSCSNGRHGRSDEVAVVPQRRMNGWVGLFSFPLPSLPFRICLLGVPHP